MPSDSGRSGLHEAMPAVGHVIIDDASGQHALVVVTVLKLGPGMALKPGLAGCWGLARTSPRQAFKRYDGNGARGLGQGVRLTTLGAKEVEQHTKQEEQLLDGRRLR